MLDFSLPPASGVLPIEGHDLLAPATLNNPLAMSLPISTQVNLSTNDVPPPPRI